MPAVLEDVLGHVIVIDDCDDIPHTLTHTCPSPEGYEETIIGWILLEPTLWIKGARVGEDVRIKEDVMNRHANWRLLQISSGPSYSWQAVQIDSTLSR